MAGGLLVLAGVFVCGFLMLKVKRDGMPIFTPTDGDIEISDYPGAEAFEEQEPSANDLFAKMDKENHEKFIKSLNKGDL